MAENGHIADSRTRKQSQAVLIALIPVIAQIALFFYIANWAEGAGSGRGMLGLLAFLILLAAVPIAFVLNILIATYTPQLSFFWMLTFALGIALLLPIVAGAALLIGP